MIDVKPGARLKSTVCSTEVVVVKTADSSIDLRCGGAPMAPLDATAEASGAPSEGFDNGTAVGKRYTDAGEAVEILCTKGGPGSLSLGDELLGMKGAKPLPASD
ncbi:MAG TPA: hypothetical protein VL961_13195 [Acidimicrobiales bacterium]|nr:hypothetical protein [Acidimicrobiales bacterium]